MISLQTHYSFCLNFDAASLRQHGIIHFLSLSFAL